MKINSTLTITSCFFFLLQSGGQAHAEILPQGCYDGDTATYELMVKLDNVYGELSPHELDDKLYSNSTDDEELDIRNYKAYINKPSTRIHINLTYTQETPNSVINIDASKSDTPSRKVQYKWISQGSSGFAHNDSSKATNTVAPFTPASSKTLSFGIKDPVCGVEQEVLISIRNKN